MTGQSNIADISFSGDGAIVFDGFSELSFGQVRDQAVIKTDLEFSLLLTN